VTIVGTRPEIIRLSRLIPKLDEHTDHVLVHTGQNSDVKLSDVFFEDLDLRQPDYYLGVDTSSMGAVMGDTLRKTEDVLVKEKPDAVLILGDTNSSIAAIVAERMHIPVYHMEAGNRSFDANVPEELNRKMVDHVASFNLPYNEYSLRNLLAEGLHPLRILKTGSPIGEIFNHYRPKIESSKILESLSLRPGKYFLASIHRQENVDPPGRFALVLDCLRAIRDEWEIPILVSTHPRTRARLEAASRSDTAGIMFHEPFGYLDYNHLQMKAFCVVSDSGTISEESYIQNFPAVSMRDSGERPEALAAGSMMLSGLDPCNLIACIKLSVELRQGDYVPDGYEVLNFSDRVLRFIFTTANKHHNWASLRPLT
jgi:UDP-N-acetylglucosamine 2-epimerase